jgi:hypothetical protein
MAQVERRHLVRRNAFQLTLDNLPPRNTRRWYPRWKIFIVRAVEIGLLSFDQASQRYSLSFEEFLSWQKLAANFDQSGVNSAVRDELRTSSLWIGSDRDCSQAPTRQDGSESFQPDLFWQQQEMIPDRVSGPQ